MGSLQNTHRCGPLGGPFGGTPHFHLQKLAINATCCPDVNGETVRQIAERSGNNPLQVFVDAICSAAPMEEITRIKFGAVSQPKAVDSSPSRRLDVALANLAKGAQQGTHKSKRTLQNCIINELTKASEGDVTSYAVGKKEELERIAASAR